MSLHDEFEALKHVPTELASWVKSLIHRVDPSDVPSESAPVVAAVEPEAMPAPIEPVPPPAEQTPAA